MNSVVKRSAMIIIRSCHHFSTIIFVISVSYSMKIHG